MTEKNIHLMWIISLAVVCVTSFLLAGSELFDFDFSDTLLRILGVIDLIALPVLVYSTVRKTRK